MRGAKEAGSAQAQGNRERVAMKPPSSEPLLRWFKTTHLPRNLAATSSLFGGVAAVLCSELPRSAERTVALRKLLEAKDAAVRATLVRDENETGEATT